jgi:hypothetical protein
LTRCKHDLLIHTHTHTPPTHPYVTLDLSHRALNLVCLIFDVWLCQASGPTKQASIKWVEHVAKNKRCCNK